MSEEQIIRKSVTTFKDIFAWQKSHALALEVYRLTGKYPTHELFGLTAQSRRCAVSVPSNLAEGFRRKSKADSLHFYNIAQRYLEELKYQLLLARDLFYISELEYKNIIELSEETSKLLVGWIKSSKIYSS